MADLAAAAAAGLGNGAVADLLGGEPGDVPDRFAAADPAALGPMGIPQLLVHGLDDEIVPAAINRPFAAAGGDEVEVVELEGCDHFDVIDPTHSAWSAVVERLPRLLG